MVHEVNLTFDVEVAPGEATISVTIGDGQVGGSSMKLDGQDVGPIGDIKDYVVGDGKSLAGRKLLVRTLVADINENSNWTSVRYHISAPSPQTPITAKKEVNNDKEAVRYNTTFEFKLAGDA